MSGALPLAPPATTSAIERRLNWRAVPLALFVVMMIALTALAMLQLRTPPIPLRGLPETQEIRIATGLARGRLTEATGPLRFYSALLGDGAMGVPATPETREAARQIGDLLNRAPEWAHADPRFTAARASLVLVRGRIRKAERLYRSAADRAPGYGEAHLGVAMALMLRAEAESAPRFRRSLRLSALAHLLAVAPADAAYPAALYDRIVMLRAVGRDDEARRTMELYRLHDPTSTWAQKLEPPATQ